MKYAAAAVAISLIGSFALAYSISTNGWMLGIGLAAIAFVAVLYWVRNSAARIATTAATMLIGLPLVPGLQEQRQPQLFGLLFVSGAFLGLTLWLAKKRKRSAVTPYAAVAIIGLLTALTAGVAHPDQFRLLVGLVLAVTVALPLAITAAADEGELAFILRHLTLIGVIAAIIAVGEAINQAPLYKFTAFQEHSNPLVAFRASSIFGHPLVLCVYLSFVALANIVRPSWTQARWYTGRLITVGVPLAGAAASGSRSIALFIAVGIIAILVMRQERVRRKGPAFLILLTAAAMGYFALADNSALTERFGSLSASEQSVRLGGLDIVLAITHGLEVCIGGGPRAVAAAYLTVSDGVTFGTVDNQFLTTYADYGLVGLALVVFLAVRLIGKLRRKGFGPWSLALVVAAMAPLTAFFVMDALAWPILAFVFGLGAGVMPERTEHEDREDDMTALPMASRAVRVRLG